MDDLAIAHTFGPITLDSIREGAYAVRTARAVNYGAIAVMLWDMLLNLDREVELIWKSRWNFVKILFFFNRYISPMVLCVDVWFMSGTQQGLGVSVCRKWYTAAYLVQIACSASTSLLVSCRLWAWYELSTPTLYFLFSVWLSGFVSSAAVMLNGLWGPDNGMVYLSAFNVCITIEDDIWIQWLSGTLSHSIYFISLFFSALTAPRSSRHTALAILYRDGLFFYLLTSATMLAALLTWRFAPRLYMGVIIYMPWITMQILLSRLLLHVRTSHIFYAHPHSSIAAMANSQAGSVSSVLNDYPLQSLPAKLSREDLQTRMSPSASPVTKDGKRQGSLAPSNINETLSQIHKPRRMCSLGASRSMSGIVDNVPNPNQGTVEREEDTEGRINGDTEGACVETEDACIPLPTWLPEYLRTHPAMKRFWWMKPKLNPSSSGGPNRTNSQEVYVYVEDYVPEGPSEVGGLRESRLGRYDHWL